MTSGATPMRLGAARMRQTSSRLVTSSTKAAASACAREQTLRADRDAAGPVAAHGQHFLGRTLEDLRDEVQDVGDAEVDRHRIPGRAHAESIDVAVGDALHHERRRQHHQPDVLVRIDPTGCHPEPQLVVVGRVGERHAEGERIVALALARRHHARQRCRRHARVGEIAVRLAPSARRAGRASR